MTVKAVLKSNLKKLIKKMFLILYFVYRFFKLLVNYFEAGLNF